MRYNHLSTRNSEMPSIAFHSYCLKMLLRRETGDKKHARTQVRIVGIKELCYSTLIVMRSTGQSQCKTQTSASMLSERVLGTPLRMQNAWGNYELRFEVMSAVDAAWRLFAPDRFNGALVREWRVSRQPMAVCLSQPSSRNCGCSWVPLPECQAARRCSLEVIKGAGETTIKHKEAIAHK